jgi:hypothetical protein
VREGFKLTKSGSLGMQMRMRFWKLQLRWLQPAVALLLRDIRLGPKPTPSSSPCHPGTRTQGLHSCASRQPSPLIQGLPFLLPLYHLAQEQKVFLLLLLSNLAHAHKVCLFFSPSNSWHRDETSASSCSSPIWRMHTRSTPSSPPLPPGTGTQCLARPVIPSNLEQ